MPPRVGSLGYLGWVFVLGEVDEGLLEDGGLEEEPPPFLPKAHIGSVSSSTTRTKDTVGRVAPHSRLLIVALAVITSNSVGSEDSRVLK